MADESTMEFKKQEKESIRQQQTAFLLSKAREDANKIEQYKQKLRQSQNGGVFTNRLKVIAEARKNQQEEAKLKQEKATVENQIKDLENEKDKEAVEVIHADLDSMLDLPKAPKTKKKKK